jgi:hypothetical protein
VHGLCFRGRDHLNLDRRVVSVLLQGRLLDRQDPQRVPPRAAFALQAVDVWLAVVFALVIFVTIAVAFDAIARGKPLVAADRRVIEHLLLATDA